LPLRRRLVGGGKGGKRRRASRKGAKTQREEGEQEVKQTGFLSPLPFLFIDLLCVFAPLREVFGRQSG
jgi:hypothetical protein